MATRIGPGVLEIDTLLGGWTRMTAGYLIEGPSPTLVEIRAHAARELECLPEPLRRLEPGASYPLEVADTLVRLAAEVDWRVAQQQAVSR